MVKELKENRFIVYQTKSGALELRSDVKNETVWATQAQVALAFGVDVRTVNEHIKNIFKTKELSEKSILRKFRIVQIEGKRNIERDISHYNLDMILSVGYRVNHCRPTKKTPDTGLFLTHAAGGNFGRYTTSTPCHYFIPYLIK